MKISKFFEGYHWCKGEVCMDETDTYVPIGSKKALRFSVMITKRKDMGAYRPSSQGIS